MGDSFEDRYVQVRRKVNSLEAQGQTGDSEELHRLVQEQISLIPHTVGMLRNFFGPCDVTCKRQLKPCDVTKKGLKLGDVTGK